MPDAERRLDVPPAYDFDEALRFVPFGLYDPACRRAPGRLWKAGRAPEGPVTLALVRSRAGLSARAWGPGAAWAVERAGALAGLRDEPSGPEWPPGPVATLARRSRGIRLPAAPGSSTA